MPTSHDLPTCPRHREGTCERSELVLAGETSTHWSFICRCCHLHWVVSKSVAKHAARYQNAIRQMESATARDRELSRQPKQFFLGAPS